MTPPSTDRPFRRRILVNTAAVGVSNGWAMVVAILSLPLLLRGLGAISFGTWALLQTFSAVSGWFSLLDFGLGTAATREVAARRAVDDQRGLAEAVGSTVVVMFGFGVASGALLAGIGPMVLPDLFNTPRWLVPQLKVAAVAFSIQVALDLLTGGFQSALDGYQRVDLSRMVDMVRRTLVAAATSAAALATHRLSTVAWASMTATAVGTLVAAVTLARVSRGLRPRATTAMVRRLMHYGRTVAVLRPLGVLHRTLDRVVVGAILGPAAVSLVEIAIQLQNGTDALLSATSHSVVPSAAHLEAQGDRHKLVELVGTGTRLSLLVTWPLAALTAVLAGPAIQVWIGPSYNNAAGLAAVAVAALALVAPAQVGSNILLGTGRAGAILRVALLAIGINLVGSIVLVQVVGVVGAFQATFLSAAITLPLLLRATLRDLGLDAREFFRTAIVPAIPTPIAAGLAAGAVVLLPLPDWPTLILGGLAGLVAAAAAAMRWGLDAAESQSLTNRLSWRR